MRNPETAPAPEGIDLTRPNAARAYDYFLGGNANWAVDREYGQYVIDNVWPDIAGVARQNRDFLRRAVRTALAAGIRQFLDLGSGIPSVGNVHHVVRDTLGDDEYARVVYVDYEPVAVAHGQVLLEREGALDWAGVVQHDIRSPQAVLEHKTTRHLLNPDEPVCVLAVAVLHFLGDQDDVPGLLHAYTNELVPGSRVVFSHFTADDGSPEDQETVQKVRDAYSKTSNPLWPRGRDEIVRWFDGLTGWKLVGPGMVHAPEWYPDNERSDEDDALWSFFWCGAVEKTG